MKILWWIFNFQIGKAALFIREWFIGMILLISFMGAQIYNDNNKILDNYSVYKKGETAPELVGKYNAKELEALLKDPYENKNLYPDKTFFDRTGNIHYFKDGTRVEIVEIYNYPFNEHLDPGWLTFKFYFLIFGFRFFIFFVGRKAFN